MNGNETNKKQKKIDSTLDLIKEKYGYGIITRATTIGYNSNVNSDKITQK